MNNNTDFPEKYKGIPIVECIVCGKPYPRTKKYFRRKHGELQLWCKQCEKPGKRFIKYRLRERELHRAQETEEEWNCTLEENRRAEGQKRERQQEQEDAIWKDIRGAVIRRYTVAGWSGNEEEAREKYRKERLVEFPVIEERPKYKGSPLTFRSKHPSRIHSKSFIEATSQLMEMQGHRCWYCGVKLNGKAHLDHFIPLSKGGTNDLGNLVWACPHCNISKGNKMPEAWSGWNGKYPPLRFGGVQQRLF